MAIASGKKTVREEAQEFDEQEGKLVPQRLGNVMLALFSQLSHGAGTCCRDAVIECMHGVFHPASLSPEDLCLPGGLFQRVRWRSVRSDTQQYRWQQ